ncbi:MAG: hypothetical protein RIT24_1176, partial [Planctomycetota bacterium]
MRRSWNSIGWSASLAVVIAAASTASAQNPPKPAPAAPAAPTLGPGPGSADSVKKAREVKELLSSQQANDQGPKILDASAPQETYDPNEPPAIQFDPPIANLGEMMANVSKTVTIKIKNVTDKPIRISKAIPGCGCTTPNWPKDPIAPGASADCEITLAPGAKQGIKLSKRVTFQIENHAPVVLTVEGDVVAFVTMTPDMIDGPADPTAAGIAPGEIVLESTEGKAFKVTAIEPPVVKNPPMDAATKHVLLIDWSMWDAAGRQPKVLVKTD